MRASHPAVPYDPSVRVVLTQPTLSVSGRTDSQAVLREQVSNLKGRLSSDDILLLPEHWEPRHDRGAYVELVRELAQTAGCHVVGGSQHEQRGDHYVNSGVVVDSLGAIVGTYEKQRPYAIERSKVRPGLACGEVVVGGRNVTVMICADVWFSDLFNRIESAPDVLLVPALSVTRHSSRDYSASLWRHLAVSRAYEFGTFVGIADWSAHSDLGDLRAAGVAGLANPTVDAPSLFFTPVAGEYDVFELDFDALDEFRRDRRERGFYWRAERQGSPSG